MKVSLPKPGEPVTLAQLGEHFKRFVGGPRAISRRQLEQFMRWSTGIPPELAVSMITLPEDFQLTPRADGDIGMALSDLSTDETGNPCYIARVNGDAMASHNDILYPLGLGFGNRRAIKLLGFKDSEPVMVVRVDSLGQTLYHGSRVVISHHHIRHPTLLRDGTVMFATRAIMESKYTLHRVDLLSGEDSTAEGFTSCPWRFALGQNHRLYLLFGGEANTVARFPGANGGLEYIGGDKMQDMIDVGGYVRFVAEGVNKLFGLRYDGTALEETSGSVARGGMFSDDYPYLKGLQKLSDGRLGYVAELPAGLMCWVVDGAPQDYFDLVSPIFERDSEYLYYACYAGRRQLLTMKVSEF